LSGVCIEHLKDRLSDATTTTVRKKSRREIPEKRKKEKKKQALLAHPGILGEEIHQRPHARTFSMAFE